jgi:hypothetical protein
MPFMMITVEFAKANFVAMLFCAIECEVKMLFWKCTGVFFTHSVRFWA